MALSSDIISALQIRLQAIANPLPTQWPNTGYEPIAGTPYQQVFFRFAKPMNPEISPLYQDTGYMQITLRYPIDGGAKAVVDQAETLRNWFPWGLFLQANTHNLRIIATASLDGAFVDANRYCIPVKIYFNANSF